MVRSEQYQLLCVLYFTEAADEELTKANRRSGHFQVDRYHRQQHLSPRVWYLRNRQGMCHFIVIRPSYALKALEALQTKMGAAAKEKE